MIGTICYDCCCGLGHLAKDFYEHGVIQKILVVPHPRYERHSEWYDKEDTFSRGQVKQFLDGLTTILVFETGFYWDILKQAQKQGIKLVLMPMYEYSPKNMPVPMDLYLCPSELDYDIYSKEFNSVFLPVPVDEPWRQRTQALKFIHNAGHGQNDLAKGTETVIQAMEYVESPIKLLVRGQLNERRVSSLFQKHKDNPKIELLLGNFPRENMFKDGDVFINAEMFNGLSLPLQEARAAGMLVMTSDRYPANTWLPGEPLIPVSSYRDYKISRVFDRAVIDPKDVAKKIDEWYGKDITEYSLSGKYWAEEMSWDSLTERYLEVLLCL